MRHLIKILGLVITIIIGGMTISYPQSPEQLYQKGLIKEEGEGALNEAIDIYNKIVKNQDAEKSLRAKALLRVGVCYEKLGKNEATKAYKQLINNFPEQKGEVAIARERLSRLTQTAEKISKIPLIPKFTKIKIPNKLSWSVALSPDGENLALVSNNKLWEMPLSGNLGQGIPGTPIQLNTENIEVEWTGLSWSRDGKWLAFNENPSKDNRNQGIYLISYQGGTPKKIIETFRDVLVVNYRISLSPDGQELAFSSVNNKEQHIYTMSVNGSTPRQLTDMQAREPVFSPDGKMIAYVEDKNTGTGSGNLGLWIVPANGGTPHLVAKADYPTSPVWSPNGDMIAFLDNSNGTKINLVSISKDGKPMGKITSIDTPDGVQEVRLLAGWTPDNKIGMLSVAKTEFALYTLPAKGGQAAIVLNQGYPMEPRWSPDNKKIYYTYYEKVPNSWEGKSLAIVSATGGEGSKLPVKEDAKIIIPYMYQSGNRISPNGETIISAATSKKTVSNKYPSTQIWKIPIDGGNPIQITNPDSLHGDFAPCWSPNGEQVAFLRFPLNRFWGEDKDEAFLYTIKSTGGNPELLIKEYKDLWSAVWSPDGKMIAYISYDKKDDISAMNVVNVISGESRMVAKIPSANVHTELAWSPDSKRIAFNDKEGKVIKVMSIADGSIEDIETNLVDVSIYHLDWSPDGKRFVFVGMKGGEKEFWFMENFLPLEKLTQNTIVKTTKEQEGIRIRQISKAPYLDDLGTVSSDGRWLSCVDWGEGDLAIRDLETGQKRLLTHQATLKEDPEKFVIASAISKNGKLVAYSWFGPYHTFDLNIFDVSKNSSKLLYKEEGVEAYPVTWLSDAELIVIRQDRNNEKTKLTVFNVKDGSFRDLKTFDQRAWFSLCTSSDEKYIAYSTTENNAGNSNIHLLSADGKSEFPLVTHPANDKVLGWIPGRKEFLFISDRSGTWDLWSLVLEDGKPTGFPKRIYIDIGDVDPIGMTNDGACYFGFSRRNFNTYIMPFNENSGQIGQDEAKTLLGSNFVVDWSPDGKSIAYIKEDKSWSLIVADINSGSERQLATDLSMVTAPKWSPDGKTIFVFGRDEDKMKTKGYKGGFYTVDVKTGKAKEVCLLTDFDFKPSEDDALPVSGHEWSRDGKSIYFLFHKDRIFKYNLATGEENIICRRPGLERFIFDISPDRKKLLFAVYDSGEKKSRLCTISVDGGNEKEVCWIQGVNYSTTAFWDKVGKYIYFTETADGTSVWCVPAEGGIPEKVWQTDKRAEMFSIHPSGKQIAFSVQERTTQVKVIEGLKQELDKIYSQNE